MLLLYLIFVGYLLKLYQSVPQSRQVKEAFYELIRYFPGNIILPWSIDHPSADICGRQTPVTAYHESPQ